jgi:hypothetical protein
MQTHFRDNHKAGLLGLLPKKYEVLASAAVSRHAWVCDR